VPAASYGRTSIRLETGEREMIAFPKRPASLILAILFLLTGVGESFASHACEIHHGAAHVTHPAVPADEGDAHGHAPEPTGSDHPRHASPDPVRPGSGCSMAATDAGDDPSSDETCTCTGTCHIGTGVALGVSPDTAHPHSFSPNDGTRTAPRVSEVPLHPPHFLPFALAPPA
jgi:hypothetical protein